MSHPERLQERIDSYLMQLRRSLGELPPGEVAEILQEIRGHILDRAEASGELTEEKLVAILKALGRPEEIAPLYHAESFVARARTSLSPVMLLRGALRWSMLSAWGFGLLLVGVFGYALGASLVLAAVGKVIAPHTVGAWVTPHGFQIGTASDPAAREVLGWWLVPVGLAGGPALVIATTRLLSWALRFARFRRPAVGVSA